MSTPAPARDTVHVPRARTQLWLLVGLWWRHMRRHAGRLGAAPRRSGVPTLVLINLLTAGYFVPLAFRGVMQSMEQSRSLFAWHAVGVCLIALGAGGSKAAGTLQVRGGRNDAFLQALPLHTLARVGLQLMDGAFIMLIAMVVPLAGAHALGRGGLQLTAAALLGFAAYLAFFMIGQAVVAWARAIGPTPTARRSGYVSIGLYLLGLLLSLTSLGQLGVPVQRFARHFARVLTHAWLVSGRGLCGLYAGALLMTVLAYRALRAAERVGFDQLEVQRSAPRAKKGVQDRRSLEWQMMLRQGGRPLLVMFGVLLCGQAWLLVWHFPKHGQHALLLTFAGFTIYLGALQTIAQAGRAARSDLSARPFLAALPLSPHQVLEGKTAALRKLLLPVFAMLGLLAFIAVQQDELSLSVRTGLALLALYIIVDGAVGVSFLSSGVGVIGVGGGQVSSSFSTQLLMMPLLTTVMANDNWASFVSLLSVSAITWEARRAAHKSVRWLDDPDDDVERETTVWRALLAASAFFAMQVLSARLLDLFDVPLGYMLAFAFFVAAVVLVLLTWRNGSRFERPRFLPRTPWAWPLGALAGGASGALALGMVKFLPAASDDSTHAFSSGELIAVFVTTVVMAPLAEEYFFRGWLQKAIERDLPIGKKHWAFALGALAFALCHLGSYGLPQLILGLCAGALYAFGGGLWPAMLAHAIHNGVVLLAGAH